MKSIDGSKKPKKRKSAVRSNPAPKDKFKCSVFLESSTVITDIDDDSYANMKFLKLKPRNDKTFSLIFQNIVSHILKMESYTSKSKLFRYVPDL